MENDLTFVCISDTHCQNVPLPPGDVLIHCGDFTKKGSKEEILAFIQWLIKQPFKYKIVIAGNHDLSLDKESYQSKLKEYHHKGLNFNDEELRQTLKDNCIYLLNSSVVIEGIKIWGSPYSLEFHTWAFQLKSEDAEVFWSQIEEDSDIIVTHGPPLNHGDQANIQGQLKNVGDEALLKRVFINQTQIPSFWSYS
ncbi:unnamed protein product (macronuclear) [Paramecium tetraurelia]|uniref:Calcineurin-like phosphoesterase domain-containing protein n=1 Tax=Paramecium tetraurelia TaxID=5888 RepID=A0CWL2_PARTE|nr:uncharacterized protein GSPATT00001382001 [Paramecium tetraurelia]CAK75179.1 unnamed protein product [Paramecium tetraurelia]|eukprot:XP_001442576.1 hypothetical protein (macronuclear) [Paramecium tetraurelia strain d4-2]